MKILRGVVALLVVSASYGAFAQDCERVNGLNPLLQQWHRSLEGWRGARFLAVPSAKLDADCSERIRTLMQWKQALELWRRMTGRLDEPSPAVLASCRRTMELLARWRFAIEGWYGNRFLDAPDPGACRSAAR